MSEEQEWAVSEIQRLRDNNSLLCDALRTILSHRGEDTFIESTIEAALQEGEQ